MNRTLLRARAALATGVGVVGLALAPFAASSTAAAAPGGASVTVTPGTAQPGDLVAIRGQGLSGCNLNKVDVYLASNNGGSSGEYLDLMAADLPVDGTKGYTIGLRHPLPTPVYSSGGDSIAPNPVNRIVVRCANGENTLASTPITIDRSQRENTEAPPAELGSRRVLLTPATGVPGSEVTLWTDLRCGTANADDDAIVKWGDHELTKLSIFGDGSESYRFTVPSGPNRGRQPVTIACLAQGAGMPDNGTLRTEFVVPAPELAAMPNRVEAGDTLRVAGSGFVACGRPVDGGAGALTVRHGSTVLGRVPVGPDGRFTGDVPVPADLPAGDGTLTIACATGGFDGDYSVALAVVGSTRAAPPDADAKRSEAAAALPDPGELFDEPRPVVLAGATAALALPVLGFSAELFNKTWENNRLRIRRRLRPGAARPRSQPRFPELQVAVFVVLSATLCVAVEPGAGWDAHTGALALALLAAVPLGVLVYEGSAESYRRRISRIRALPRLVPGALGVALLLATASRLLDLTPGYVYGLFLAFTSAGLRRMSPADEGRATAIGAWSLAGLAVVAWVWRIPVSHILDESKGTPFGWVFAENLLTQCFVAGVVGLVFGLLPMRFMDGHALWRWNRWAWATIYGAAVFLFVLVLLDPTGAAQGATRDMWLRSTILFGAAAVISVGFWAVFRLRPARPNPWVA